MNDPLLTYSPLTDSRPTDSIDNTAAESPLLPAPRWTAELAYRFRHLWWLKLAGITGGIGIFFIGYFHLLRHPTQPPVTMALTALDRLIPLQPPMVIPYLSLWVYVGIAPGLQRTFRELFVYGLWSGALCASGLVAFYFWPTAVAPLAAGASNFPGFVLLQGIDASGNACPSMHVAIASFSAIGLDDLLRKVRAPGALRLVNIAWFVAIAYSTMAVKQHVAVDVLAGAVLGSLFALASLCWRPSGRLGSRERRQRGAQLERISSPATDRRPLGVTDDDRTDMTTDLDHQSTVKELQALLQEKFAIDASMLDPHASMKERGGMDSLALVEYVFAVEDHFHISLSDEDSAIDTLTELAALVDKARAAKAA